MRRDELIEILKDFPKDAKICLVDLRDDSRTFILNEDLIDLTEGTDVKGNKVKVIAFSLY